MPFSLGDRQAISMRANAASEHGIAIDVKVVRCDRGRDRRRTTGYKFRRFDRRYMLKYDLEVGQFAHERREDAIDKNRLAVEDIDRRLGHLAMDKERHTDARSEEHTSELQSLMRTS